MSDNEKRELRYGERADGKGHLLNDASLDNTQQEIEALKQEFKAATEARWDSNRDASELAAHIERLREIAKNVAAYEYITGYRGEVLSDVFKQAPAQSLQEIEQRVEKETIKRIEEEVIVKTYSPDKQDKLIQAIRNLPSAYKEE